MSTTDPDLTTSTTSGPLARFLAGEPVPADGPARSAEREGVDGRPGLGGSTGPGVAGAARGTDAVGVANGHDAAAGVGTTGGLGALALRGTERRAGLRGGLLGASRPAVDVAIRPATDADRAVLGHLASVDGGRIPGAPLLIAERAGVAVAAVGVLDRRVIADPTADATAAIDRLQALAAEQRGPARRRRWAARLRRATARRRATAGAGRSDAAIG